MTTSHDGCFGGCGAEVIALQRLKDEERNRIACDEHHAIAIDNLANHYGRLATTVERIEQRIRKLESLKWQLGAVLAAASFAAQLVGAFFK